MRLATIATALCLAAAPAAANEFEPAMADYLENHIRAWANSQVLIDAVLAQNAANSGLSQADIDTLDLAWRAEVGGASTPTITPVMENAAADFLREHVAAAGGAITEVFVMDNLGLNVAASDVTSDMWQGDEAKFQKTYLMGAEAVHFSDVEFDESSQTYQAQISIPLVNPSDGSVVGAITVGVDANALL